MAHITHITQGAVPPHPIHRTVIGKRESLDSFASYLPVFLRPPKHSFKKLKVCSWLQQKTLGGGNSNIFYVQPDPWGNDPF